MVAVMRRVDKSKKTNTRCSNCEFWDGELSDSGFCKLHEKNKNYWNRCKSFKLSKDIEDKNDV